MKGPIAESVLNGKALKREVNAKNGDEPFDILVQPTLKVETALEKKLRNLEKRRQKLNQIRSDEENGAKLTAEQRDAISKLDEVVQQIDFIKDLQKLVTQQSRQYQRALRQRDNAEAEKNSKKQYEIVSSVVHYQEALKVLGTDGTKSMSDIPNLTSNDVEAVKKIADVLYTTKSTFDSTVDWENHVKTTTETLYAISTSSERVINDNPLTGLKAKSVIDQLLESPGFQSVITKTYDNGSADGEETETDESSLNDFQPESAVCSPQMMESNQENDNTNSPSPVSDVSNQESAPEQSSNVVPKADDNESNNTRQENVTTNNDVIPAENNSYLNNDEKAKTPDSTAHSAESVENVKEGEVAAMDPPVDDTQQEPSTEEPKKYDRPIRRNYNYMKDRPRYPNQQNWANDGRVFRRDFQNRGPRKYNNDTVPRANPPVAANGESQDANNENPRSFKRYSYGEQGGRYNNGGFYRRSVDPNGGAAQRRYRNDYQSGNQQNRQQNVANNAVGINDYEKRSPRIHQPYECGFRFAV